MDALVTGVSGFVGRHFARELRWRGWNVRGIDTSPFNDGGLDWISPTGVESSEGFPEAHYGNFEFTRVDALSFFRDDREKFDLVVHAAAMEPNRVAIDSMPVTHIRNRALDAAMFDWATATQQSHILYLSSCAALDADPDDYGSLKLAGERLAILARRAGTPVTVVRPFSGYGCDQSTAFPFGAFIDRAIRRENPFEVWGDGLQVRDLIHIDDIVAGSLAIVEAGCEEPISLCTGVGTSMIDLARMIVNMSGYSPDFVMRGDMPSGESFRVGNPSQFNRFYKAQVSLEEGIIRALNSRYGKGDRT